MTTGDLRIMRILQELSQEELIAESVNELIVQISSQLMDGLDLTELKEDEETYVLVLIKASALEDLRRYGEEAEMRKIIFEIRKRSNGEMKLSTIKAKQSLAQALLNNYSYNETLDCLTKFEDGVELTRYYHGMIWELLDESASELYESGNRREFHEFRIKVVDTLVNYSDLNELKKDDDKHTLYLLGIKAYALEQLKRYGEEMGLRKIIHEAWKRCYGEMDKETTDTKMYLAKRLLKNKKYDEALKLLTKIEINLMDDYYMEMTWESLREQADYDNSTEFLEFRITCVTQLTNGLDLTELKRDGMGLLHLLEVKSKSRAFNKLKRYGEELGLRETIYKTYKRWIGEMKYLIPKKYLAKALLNNQKYNEAFDLLTNFENEIISPTYYEVIWQLLDEMNENRNELELNEFTIKLVGVFTDVLDLNELEEDEDWIILDLLEIKSKSLASLHRIEEEIKVREIIYKTYKIWNGEMDEDTLDSKRNLALALIDNKNYEEAVELLAKFGVNLTYDYYCMIGDLLDEIRDDDDLNEFKTRALYSYLSSEKLDRNELKVLEFILEVIRNGKNAFKYLVRNIEAVHASCLTHCNIHN